MYIGRLAAKGPTATIKAKLTEEGCAALLL